MKRFRVTLVILVTVLAMSAANAGSPYPLFQDDAALSVEITTPFSRLINERPKNYEFQGSFSFKGLDGAALELDLQVRLLDVTYVDSENRRPHMVRNAFLIEHENRMADRLDAQRLDIFPDRVEDIQADHLNLTSVFQYLLGNTDFSPILGSKGECRHNYAMFGTDGGPLLAIPYDIDMSGFVNTPYAEPDEELGIDNVRQRLYQGFCVNNNHVEASVSEFLQTRDTLYALITDLRGLDQSVRERLAAYMDEFYETSSDPGAVKRELIERSIQKTGAG